MRGILKKILDVVFPEEVLLVGVNVEPLYKSIPHKWGLLAVAHFLNIRYPEIGAQNEFLMELLEYILMNNSFQFRSF